MYLVYQAYGSEEIARQVALSLHSLCAVTTQQATPIRVRIYTDDESLLAGIFGKSLIERIGIEFVSLTTAQIQTWRGTNNFVHRLKVEVLRHAMGALPKEKIIYLDSDTLFLKDPAELWAQIGAKQSLMHRKEDSFNRPLSPLTRKLKRYVAGKAFPLGDGTKHFPSTTSMWNAGVLGLDPSFAPYLNEVLGLTDLLYAGFRKHVMEQFAFSYVLGRETEIMAAEPYIYHYWFAKDNLNPVMAHLLENQTALNRFLEQVLPIWAEKWQGQVPKQRWYHKLLDLRKPIHLPSALDQA